MTPNPGGRNPSAEAAKAAQQGLQLNQRTLQTLTDILANIKRQGAASDADRSAVAAIAKSFNSAFEPLKATIAKAAAASANPLPEMALRAWDAQKRAPAPAPAPAPPLLGAAFRPQADVYGFAPDRPNFSLAPRRRQPMPEAYGIAADQSPRVPLADAPARMPEAYGLKDDAPAPSPVVAAAAPADPCVCFTQALSPILKHVEHIATYVSAPVLTAVDQNPPPLTAPAVQSPAVQAAAPDEKKLGPLAQFLEGMSQAGQGFRDFFRHTVDAVGAVAGVKDAWGQFVSALAPAGQALQQFKGHLAEIGGWIVTGAKTLASRIANALPEGVKAIGARAVQAAGSLGQAGVAGVKAAVGLGKAGVGVARGVRGLAKAGAGVVKGVGGGALGALGGVKEALMAPIQAFTSLTSTVTGFVEALNPAAVQVLGQAFRDLSAVIGVALEPVITMASGVVRDFANTLLPVMQQMRPVVAQLSQTFANLAGVYINAFASALQALTPVLKFVADAVAAVSPLIQSTVSVFSGLVEAGSAMVKSFLGWAGVDIESSMKSLRGAFESLGKGVILAAGHVVKFVGGLQAFEAFRSGVGRAFGQDIQKKDSTGIAAAQNATIGGLQDFTRRVQTASLIAGLSKGPSKEERNRQFQEDILKELGNISKNQEDWLTKALTGWWNGIKNEIRVSIKKEIASTFGVSEEAADAFTEGFGIGGETARNAISFLNPFKSF